ncbi:hypothetical protein [Streptomyces sp. NRRL WC-3742]|uniref:Rv1733c family protein n=1 Tax=Streptomyces sp. NRRL WC-3742 TaxID=1463934 RepID=UPI0004C7D3D8|nr:hypothetical protein [Streptomyces sp. NRRL WC-3742]
MSAGPRPRLRRHLRQAFGQDANPLVRLLDRSRSRSLLLALLGAALAVLASAGATGASYTEARHDASVTAARLHPVRAVTLTPARHPTAGERGRDLMHSRADATWAAPDGRTVTGTVTVPPGTAAGTAVGILADDSGRFAEAPPGATASAVDAAFLGVSTLIGLLALVAAGLHLRLNTLNRWATRAWEHSWTLLEPVWSGRAPRDHRAR